MGTTFKVRNLINEDILDVMSLQKQVYTKDLQEDNRVFIQILNVFPEGVSGVFYGDTLAGYLFSHPYILNQIKPLNSSLYFTGNENCLYLHDMAILPNYQGKGLTKLLFQRFLLTSTKNDFEMQCLVAVQNSFNFWGNFGFKRVFEVNDLGYSNGIYMQKVSRQLLCEKSKIFQ
jgi:predicted acetyltransferase